MLKHELPNGNAVYWLVHCGCCGGIFRSSLITDVCISIKHRQVSHSLTVHRAECMSILLCYLFGEGQRGALAVVHHPPYFGYIHLQQERRVRTAPPVSVRVRVRVSVTKCKYRDDILSNPNPDPALLL